MPKIGNVKIKQHRLIGEDEIIKNVTVSKIAGKYYVSICVEYEEQTKSIAKECIAMDKVLGLDYSSTHLYVGSNGKVCDHNRYYRASEDKLAIAQRRLSRKKRNSSNYKKQLQKVQKIHVKIANQRFDTLHKESNQITNDYDLICFEDINLSAMKRCLNLGKNTSDNGFGMLRTFIEYKTKNKGKHTVKIDKFYPSTKLCHCCSYKNDEITLATREWTCPSCGEHHDRDINASINIKKEGYRLAMIS